MIKQLCVGGAAIALIAMGIWFGTEESTAPSAIPDSQSIQRAAAELSSSRAPTPIRRPFRPAIRRSASTAFSEFVEHLFQLALEAHGISDPQSAKSLALQERADAVWHELHETIAQPDEKALFMLCDALREGERVKDEALRRICMRIIAVGLEHRLRGFRATGNRTALDHLVANLLANILIDDDLGANLANLLIDGPYLGLAHEQAVLDLVTATANLEHPRILATGLLTTLWDNLEASAARTSNELAGLALLFKDDANPGRRLAALQHLLAARQGRYRDVVIQDVLRERDRRLAQQVGVAAASRLEPAAALEILEQLADLDSPGMTTPFMLLGEREPDILARAYDHHLGTGGNASLRANLVTGFGSGGWPEGVELARTAFDLDPDPEVRARAMFVLTGRAGSALGERTLMAALDDPRFANDSLRLGQIGIALENLAKTNDMNAIDRVGQRLLAQDALLASDRARLKALLERHLPRHETKE